MIEVSITLAENTIPEVNKILINPPLCIKTVLNILTGLHATVTVIGHSELF